MKPPLDEKSEDFTTIRVHSDFANLVKVEAAKGGIPMYEWLEGIVLDVVKKRRGAK